MNRQLAESRTARQGAPRRRAFTLAELLVVVGVVALLIAITLPPLQMARRQVRRVQCQAQLSQLGRGLEHSINETGFYPLPDDGGVPVRYTWIDVLIENRWVGSVDAAPERVHASDIDKDEKLRRTPRAFRLGYCPSDQLPDPINAQRHPALVYPVTRRRGGVDYSYGVGVPLASGGWELPRSGSGPGQPSAHFDGVDMQTSRRILAADAYDPAIFNLSADALDHRVWNRPTQFDNTMAWLRHQVGEVGVVNALFQDGHVQPLTYDPSAERPIDTALAFAWRAGEPTHVRPGDVVANSLYPSVAPPHYAGDPPGRVIPDRLVPKWFTDHEAWTLINHKW